MKNIFRKYDIRGIVGQELNNETMYKIGRAFATYVAQSDSNRILVGRDNRLSSPNMSDTIIQALIDSGCEVINLGIIVTPMLYFASKHLGINAGIMITASHNPSEYNGCKLLFGDSTIYGEEIQKIYRLCEQENFVRGFKGSVANYDITEEYFQMMSSKIKLGPNRQKVVIDCGNGTASLFAPELFRRLGCEVIELYCESDPTFPNHHPDPVNPQNMQALIKEVEKNQADIGIGIDGDGDRLGVVGTRGNIIWGDILMILFLRDILPHYPNSKCIVEVKCSQSLIDEIRRLGCEPIIYKTGHSLIKAKMREIGSVFTGEMSGHLFFADDYYGFDDALYAGARLIALLSNSDKTIDEMLADIPRYYSTPEIRLQSSDEEKFDIVAKVFEHFDGKYQIIDVDGARILFPGGWGLVRASNTGPEVIVRCEGDSTTVLNKITAELFSYLEQIGIENTYLQQFSPLN